MTKTEHVYSVVLRPADHWVSVDTYQLECSCGIKSGASWATAQEASREARHSR